MSDEAAIRAVVDRIQRAWRAKELAGLETCFHDDSVILGPGHVELARGRAQCAESYREFATNAHVLAYTESAHALRVFGHTAVFTFSWDMTFRREQGPTHESGTDQLVLALTPAGWQVVFRYMHFTPAPTPT